MSFVLPKYEELTDSQRVIVNLPTENHHIIVGAPGTGKTVIAIYRARDMVEAGKKVMLLVFNNPLRMYIDSAIDSLSIDANVLTIHSWIYKFYKGILKKEVPTASNDSFSFDWDKINDDFASVGKVYDQVVIDEAQDVSTGLIDALKKVSNGITCLMDDNQALNKKSSYLDNIIDHLGVRAAYYLKNNFRNTKEIFDFASVYVQTALEPITVHGNKPILKKATGYKDELEKIISGINDHSDSKHIGIFVNPSEQEELYKRINNAFPDTDVFMYKTGNKIHNSLDFEDEGIYILNFNCMKGLEFDYVIIPGFDRIESRGNRKIDSNYIYVALTRASKDLLCLYSGNRNERMIDTLSPLANSRDVVIWK